MNSTSKHQKTSGTEWGQLEGRDGCFFFVHFVFSSVKGDVNAGELFPLVGPSCNDKIYQTRVELRPDRLGRGVRGVA